MRQELNRPMAGKTVLVTGGSSGIGKATAVGLAALGAHLAITGRDRDRTEQAAREIQAAGGGHGRRVRRRPVLPVRGAPAGGRGRCNGFRGSMCWSTTSAGTGTPDTSPPTGSSTPSPSTISRRSCSPTCSLDRLTPQRPGPRGDRVVQRASPGPDRLRRPPGRAALLRRQGLQPVQARQRLVHLRARPEAAGHDRESQSPPTPCTLGW